MSGSSPRSDDGDGQRDARRSRDGGGRTEPEDGGAPELCLAIISHDSIPDRATVYPPGLTGIERMETWLSVDLDVVVDLTAWR